MARKKKESAPEIISDYSGEIFPNGAHFGIIQLPRDLAPKPASQRIVQWVNRNGKLVCYVSENAYFRSECLELYWKLIKDAYAESISRGAANLHPFKGKIHWCMFTEEFCLKGNGLRMDPATDEPEGAKE